MNHATMRNFLFVLGLILSAAPVFAQTPSKLGHIDRQKLMLMLPERKDAEAKMQAFAKKLDDQLRAMGAEYENKVAEVQAGADGMTETERQMAIREIGELEQRIQAAQQKAQEDLAKQEEELLRPMVERTNKAIKTVADANGFTYIFDTSTGFVLYHEKGEDIMSLVKTELGI